jgi:transcriptional regulator with XRE-family HTH domain
MKIGPAIRKLREERGMTLEALIDRGVSSDASNLSRLERGRQKPSYDLLLEISAALGVKLSEIFSLAEREEAEVLEKDPALRSIVTKYNKLTPHHQAILGEVITSLIKLQKRQE